MKVKKALITHLRYLRAVVASDGIVYHDAFKIILVSVVRRIRVPAELLERRCMPMAARAKKAEGVAQYKAGDFEAAHASFAAAIQLVEPGAELPSFTMALTANYVMTALKLGDLEECINVCNAGISNLETGRTFAGDSALTCAGFPPAECVAVRKLAVKLRWRRGIAHYRRGAAHEAHEAHEAHDDFRTALRDFSAACSLQCRVTAKSTLPASLLADFEKARTRLLGSPKLRGLMHPVRTEVYNTTNLHPRPFNAYSSSCCWNDLLFYFSGQPDASQDDFMAAAAITDKHPSTWTMEEHAIMQRIRQSPRNLVRGDRLWIFDLRTKRWYTRACEGAPARESGAMACWAPAASGDVDRGCLWNRTVGGGNVAATLFLQGGKHKSRMEICDENMELYALELPSREELLAGGCKLENARHGGLGNAHKWRVVDRVNGQLPIRAAGGDGCLSEHSMFLRDCSAESSSAPLEIFLYGADVSNGELCATWVGKIKVKGSTRSGGGRRRISMQWRQVSSAGGARSSRLGYAPYTPVARSLFAHATVGNRYVYIQGGATSGVDATAAFDVLDMVTRQWSPLPRLGDAPRHLQEHTLFAYNHAAHVGGDSGDWDTCRTTTTAATHLLLFGGYVPEIGSGGYNGVTLESQIRNGKIDGQDSPSVICGAPYRRSFYRCNLETNVWTKVCLLLFIYFMISYD